MNRTPSVDIDLGRVGPALSHFTEMDELREKHRYFWNERGQYWVLTRGDDIHEAGHNPEVFSNHSIVPTEPEPDYRFLPSHLDGPQHVKYRHVMNAWFAPRAMARFAPEIRRLAREVVDDIAPLGEANYMTTFGERFPIRVLLASIGGIPLEDGPMLVERVRRRARLRAQGDIEGSMQAWREMETYWVGHIDDRRKNPGDPTTDFITHLINARVDDEPLPEADLVDILVTLTVGGVDTMKAQLGWCIYHLATHPEDLRTLVNDPDAMPAAIEEFLRAYAVIGMGRKVTQDIDFHGCPMHKGDMVLLWYPSASRDPETFPAADEVHIDRENNRHVTFGSSLHRCLGSHLARAELTIAVEEWIRQVPEFHLVGDTPPRAIGGQIALLELPLAWKV